MTSRVRAARMTVRGAMTSILCAISALHCGGDDPATSGPPAPAATSGTPAQLEPSEPGYLEVRPSRRALLVGESLDLAADVFDGDGPPVSAQQLTFESETPDVLAVDAAGHVTALALGLGEVLVQDGGRRQRSVAVPVLESLPAGPVAAHFQRPLVAVAVGERASVPLEVLDASGAALPAQPIALAASAVGASPGEAEVSFEQGVAVIVARKAGVVEVTAGDAASPLFGRLLVMIYDGAQPPAAECGLLFGGCWLLRPAEIYTRPGVTDTARLELVEYRHCGQGGDDFIPRYRQVSPSRIDIGDSGVLRLNGGGQIEAVAPGITGIGASWDRWACNCFNARVLPDVNGCWQIECGAEKGWASFSSSPPPVFRRYPDPFNGWHEHAVRKAKLDAKGASALSGEQGFSCTGPSLFHPVVPNRGLMCSAAGSPAGYPTHFEASGFTCSSGYCDGSVLSFCGVGRHVSDDQPALIRGPEAFEVGRCKLTRGSACASGPATLEELGKRYLDSLVQGRPVEEVQAELQVTQSQFIVIAEEVEAAGSKVDTTYEQLSAAFREKYAADLARRSWSGCAFKDLSNVNDGNRQVFGSVTILRDPQFQYDCSFAGVGAECSAAAPCTEPLVCRGTCGLPYIAPDSAVEIEGSVKILDM